MVNLKAVVKVFLITLVTVATPFSAAEEKKVGSGPNPFADCGIGAALFPNTSWAAVSSNVIWDIGTTAVTSATASPETCNGKKAEAAQFIIDNYDNLAEETAQGGGEHLTAVLSILGCKANAHGAIVSIVRSGMTKIVSQPTYTNQHSADKQHLTDKASAFYSLVDDAIAREFTNSCSV